jgi:hypothetical protein
MLQPIKEPTDWEKQITVLQKELDTLVGEKRRVSWAEFVYLVGRYRELLNVYKSVRFELDQYDNEKWCHLRELEASNYVSDVTPEMVNCFISDLEELTQKSTDEGH